jgi:hypothetical protein
MEGVTEESVRADRRLPKLVDDRALGRQLTLVVAHFKGVSSAREVGEQCVELSPRPQRGVTSSCPVIRLFSELPRMSLWQIGEHDRPVVEQPTEPSRSRNSATSTPVS